MVSELLSTPALTPTLPVLVLQHCPASSPTCCSCGQLPHSHTLGSYLPATLPPGSALLCCTGEVQGLLSCHHKGSEVRGRKHLSCTHTTSWQTSVGAGSPIPLPQGQLSCAAQFYWQGTTLQRAAAGEGWASSQQPLNIYRIQRSSGRPGQARAFSYGGGQRH